VHAAERPLPPALLRLADERAWAAGAVLIAAHPDDETIGAGGVMPDLPLLAVVRVTDGAPLDRRWWGDPSQPSRDAYAEARRRELADALALAGVGADRMRTLGRVDQRASDELAALAREVAALLDDLRPGVVLAHPYEGGHPDHDAAAFAVHLARELMSAAPPVVLEFTSYHASGDSIATGAFLPSGATATAENPPEAVIPLAPEERERKRRMIACFASQAETLAQFPVGEVERFRAAPEYDFTQAPHGGTLYYERFDWGGTGDEWRARATAALEALGVREVARC
jgi:LmbE family N-acetylglucosaminyl deacetylase